MILLIILILFVFGLLLWQISNIISITKGSIYVAANRDIITYALKKAGLKKHMRFVDLGSGTGNVVIIAQKIGAKSYGVEISPFYYIISLFRTVKLTNTNIIFGDIRSVDLKNVDVVYCYLLPKFLNELKDKFIHDRPKKIISISFPIPKLRNKKAYLYKKRLFYIYNLRK